MVLLDVVTLLLIVVLGFLLMGALAPFEALGWWAGWYGHELEPQALLPAQEDDALRQATAQALAYRQYVVFLSGIHSVSGVTYARREILLLEELRTQLPEAKVVEVFPYSVTNRALNGERFFAWLWRFAYRMKKRGLGFAGFVINLRNLWQVAVSADSRYGPIYNQGTAELVLRELIAQGYPLGSGIPIIFIGYSGGGQVAVGAAGVLADIVEAPLTVISLGGVVSSDPGLLHLKHFYHLYGDNDHVHRMGQLLCPDRWPIFQHSEWNQAKAKGVITWIPLGPPKHTGKRGYLDSSSFLPDGRSYFQQTLEHLLQLIRAQMPE